MRRWSQKIKISGDWIMYSADPRDSNLHRNPDAAQFEEKTQRILKQIAGNAVGKILLDAFTGPPPAPHDVTIRPVSRDAIFRQGAIANFEEKANETDDEHANVGSDVTIWFNTDGPTVSGHVFRSDDTLVHEIVHALRQVRGRWRNMGNASYDSREELFATMITNIYASSDKRNQDMRGSHSRAFVPMTQTPDAFMSQWNHEILDFRTYMDDIYSSIARLQVAQAAWNPLRLYEILFWSR
jgi:Effector protein